MEIALIIIASLALLGVIVLLLVFIMKSRRKNENNSLNDVTNKKIQEMQEKLAELNTSLPLTIQKDINKEFIEVMEKLGNNNAAYNDKLNKFQIEMSKTINDRLAEINKKVEEKLAGGFKDTTKTFTDVIERLAKIDEAQKNIESLSSQVVSLTDILQNNQARGKFGEYQLSLILENVFGNLKSECYEEQYVIKKGRNGEEIRPDAVVFLPEPNHLICIDSKFPFQHYKTLFETKDDKEIEEQKKTLKADIKKHITAIKNKYIIEGETASFAIMFIPNDGIFAYVHNELTEIVSYAREQKIIITSPSTLPPILVTFKMNHVNYQRSQNIKEIEKNLTALSKDFAQFGGEWEKLNRSINSVYTNTEKVNKRVDKIQHKFDIINEGEISNIVDIEETKAIDLDETSED